MMITNYDKVYMKVQGPLPTPSHFGYKTCFIPLYKYIYTATKPPFDLI